MNTGRIDTKLDKTISENITKENKEKKEEHTPSGKLSASILGWPTQWQVLKYLGIPQPPFDEYVLRMFLRGRHVEDYIVSQMDGAKTQVKVEYRNCVGYLDALWNDEIREVKSVKNSKYSFITKAKEADHQHKLQGCYYAMGLEKEWYYIDYVAADDYRVTSFSYETDELRSEVDQIITEYEEAIKSKTVPLFKPRYAWQEKSQYNNYPEFMGASPKRINDLLKYYKVKWDK
jgi:hypothetical protein